MDANIVEQAGSIEAEADRLVAEAGERARRLAESLPSAVQALRDGHEQELQGRLESLRGRLERETAAELVQIEENARGAMRRLQSLDEGDTARAIALIAYHLRGNGACR